VSSWFSPSSSPVELWGSALGVQVELIADDVFVDAVREMLAQAIRQGQEQVIDALFIENARQDSAGLSTVILAQELTDLLHRDIALEIQVEILE
jgi:hypothetical protein